MPTIMTPREVAALFKVSLPTVRRWAYKGTLPAIRIGGLLRFDREHVERAVKAMEK